jgi:hypothetical protein
VPRDDRKTIPGRDEFFVGLDTVDGACTTGFARRTSLALSGPAIDRAL